MGGSWLARLCMCVQVRAGVGVCACIVDRVCVHAAICVIWNGTVADANITAQHQWTAHPITSHSPNVTLCHLFTFPPLPLMSSYPLPSFCTWTMMGTTTLCSITCTARGRRTSGG